MSETRETVTLGIDIPKSLQQLNKDLKKIGSYFKGLSSTHLRDAVSDLKEIDSLLTQISRLNLGLSKSELAKLGNSSFDIAGKYGKKAADYLSAVRDASRAGFRDAEGIAQLSLALQSAGGLTEKLAAQYLAAADSAYRLGGSAERLREVLDGTGSIAGRNALSLEALAQGMTALGSEAADLGLEAGQAASALSALLSSTSADGAEAAEALGNLLHYLGQVTDAQSGIDSKGLAEYARACRELNVSLWELRDGEKTLREPMDVLKDLSAAYRGLDPGDTRRADLLSSVGGGENGEALNTLLENYGLYEAMLKDYSQGMGALSLEARKAADSWEGSLNRLSNTWADTLENVAGSDAIIGMIDSLNGLLSVVNRVTQALGSFGSAGLGAGMYMGLKNVGEEKRYSSFVLNTPTITAVLRDTGVFCYRM